MYSVEHVCAYLEHDPHPDRYSQCSVRRVGAKTINVFREFEICFDSNLCFSV